MESVVQSLFCEEHNALRFTCHICNQNNLKCPCGKTKEECVVHNPSAFCSHQILKKNCVPCNEKCLCHGVPKSECDISTPFARCVLHGNARCILCPYINETIQGARKIGCPASQIDKLCSFMISGFVSNEATPVPIQNNPPALIPSTDGNVSTIEELPNISPSNTSLSDDGNQSQTDDDDFIEDMTQPIDIPDLTHENKRRRPRKIDKIVMTAKDQFSKKERKILKIIYCSCTPKKLFKDCHICIEDLMCMETNHGGYREMCCPQPDKYCTIHKHLKATYVAKCEKCSVHKICKCNDIFNRCMNCCLKYEICDHRHKNKNLMCKKCSKYVTIYRLHQLCKIISRHFFQTIPHHLTDDSSKNASQSENPNDPIDYQKSFHLVTSKICLPPQNNAFVNAIPASQKSLASISPTIEAAYNLPSSNSSSYLPERQRPQLPSSIPNMAKRTRPVTRSTTNTINDEDVETAPLPESMKKYMEENNSLLYTPAAKRHHSAVPALHYPVSSPVEKKGNPDTNLPSLSKSSDYSTQLSNGVPPEHVFPNVHPEKPFLPCPYHTHQSAYNLSCINCVEFYKQSALFRK